jgi:hypothetical protein
VFQRSSLSSERTSSELRKILSDENKDTLMNFGGAANLPEISLSLTPTSNV